jgi:DNA-binding SARP family transcriptional activator
VHALARLAQIRESRGEDEAAVDVYLRGLDVDPMVESFYQGLMRCYHRLGRRSEAISAYHRLKQILSITLGLAPSQASEKLYESLRLE